MFDSILIMSDAKAQDWAAGLIAGLASFFISIVIVSTKKWHGVYSLDTDVGIQKFHSNPTPRIGGVAIFIALIFAINHASASVVTILRPILYAGFIVFAVGLLEDFTQSVGVFFRLFATFAAGIAAWYLTQYSITRLDIIYLDILLKYLPVSVLFTAFAVGGVANSINIIDGLNGLSGFISILALAGLASISFAVGDSTLAMTAVILALTMSGFLFVNWPLGKIFLGDGGAYFIGFSLSWLCVLLAERHSNVTAFVALLVCIHPVTEVLFSIFRRRVRHVHPGHPDRLHLHSLIKSRFINKKIPHFSEITRNSVAGMLVGFMSLIPVCFAQYVYTSTRLSIVCALIFIYIYVALYARLVHFKWYSPFRFIFYNGAQSGEKYLA